MSHNLVLDLLDFYFLFRLYVRYTQFIHTFSIIYNNIMPKITDYKISIKATDFWLK